MKLRLIIGGILFLTSSSIFAQILVKDEMILAAKTDVRLFKLGSEKMKIFRKNKENFNSDFFKPNFRDVSNPGYLLDSTYNTTFRQIAYIETLKRRTAGHYALLVGSGVVSLFGALLITLMIAYS